MVVSELRGEKIDIIPYNDEPARFVAKALSPARVREVLVDDEQPPGDRDRPRRPALAGDRPRGPERAARRPPHRLAHRHPLRDRVRHRGAGRDLRARRRPSGPLRRDPRNGRRCPNASLPGSRYCGLTPHQALEGSGSDYVAGAPPEEIADDVPGVEETLGDGIPSEDGGPLEPAPEAAEPDAIAADEPTPEPAEERTS